MTAFLRDLRLAVRVLLGAKTWTLVILLSLALGIGANTALFTAANGLLLQTVSVHEPERLVRFNHAGRNDMVRNSNDYGYSGTSGTRNLRSTFSFPMNEQLRAANTTLTGLAAGVPMGSLNVVVNGDAQMASGYQATGNYFTVIGVSAVLGRVFGEADDRPSAPPVAVISHAYGSKRFAGEPAAIGRVVSINGQMVAQRSPDDRRRAGAGRRRHGPRRRPAGAARLERESARRLAAGVGRTSFARRQRTTGSSRKLVMPVRRLPVRPDFDQLHRQAKELLRDIRAGHATATAELREFHPRVARVPKRDSARLGRVIPRTHLRESRSASVDRAEGGGR